MLKFNLIILGVGKIYPFIRDLFINYCRSEVSNTYMLLQFDKFEGK